MNSSKTGKKVRVFLSALVIALMSVMAMGALMDTAAYAADCTATSQIGNNGVNGQFINTIMQNLFNKAIPAAQPASCGTAACTASNPCNSQNCANQQCNVKQCSNQSCTNQQCNGQQCNTNQRTSFAELLKMLLGSRLNNNSGGTAPVEQPKQEVTKPETPKTEAPAPTVLSYEEQIVVLVNKERAKENLPALTLSKKLSDVAKAKSQDMHDKKYFSHTSPTYGSPFEMMTAFGISYRSAGENIASGYATPEKVMQGWMNSQGHKENIMNKSFTQIGVGYVADGNYWTQMFTD